MIPEIHICDRCKKKYDAKDGGSVVINLGPYNFAGMDELCMDCLEELQKWIDKGIDEDTIQKMQDLEQAQLDKAYEIGYQVGYEEGKLWKKKEEV